MAYGSCRLSPSNHIKQVGGPMRVAVLLLVCWRDLSFCAKATFQHAPHWTHWTHEPLFWADASVMSTASGGICFRGDMLAGGHAFGQNMLLLPLRGGTCLLWTCLLYSQAEVTHASVMSVTVLLPSGWCLLPDGYEIDGGYLGDM